MGSIIARFLIIALSFLLAAYIIPGIEVESFYIALILAFFWGVINLTLKPILLILTLPINLLTFGLFTVVLNALLLWFLSTFIDGFLVVGFGSAILGALILSLASGIGAKLIKAIK